MCEIQRAEITLVKLVQQMEFNSEIKDLSCKGMVNPQTRRGKSERIFSDNATNFVGTQLELKRLREIMSNCVSNLSKFLCEERVEWSFIPPRAPNHGGLWEAGVKAVKYHLRRVMGNLRFTYEEFLTILNQIEGVLNSRPLYPLSCDPGDFDTLTPGHFLVGRPITAIAEPSLTEVSDNRLKVWQKQTKIVQHIWKRWSNNYLSTLQNRNKWYFEKNNVKIHDMVILKEDNLPVCNWPLGRILEVYHADNYPKAIAQLQERLNREDLLVQIYVRDLLSMVMRNAAIGCSKKNLKALYDKLEANIRALESLGRTQDKYGEFLNPLVESCLPEDILLAFERSKNFKEDTPGEGRTFKLLMNFLKQEVKNDEMVELARNNFSAPVNQKKKRSTNRISSLLQLRCISFSGVGETFFQLHDVYELLICSLDESYSLPVEMFSEKKICGKVPKVSSPVVISELNSRGNVLSDLENEDCKIDILIGANVAGLVFMDGCIELQSGLFLLKTRLGYVLTGKQGVFEKCNEELDTVLNVISLLVKELPVNEL
ncbi:DUF1758 domain-containing protein [Trichonephila clavipes]|nr:DUF1758 domain-containing protein [Trichonephila clavipes]